MNLVGYLITLANLQSFGGPNGPLKDLTIRVSEVGTLAEELKALPQFQIGGFDQNGFFRIGNVAKYLSKNLREYINGGNVDPRDEGIVLTLYYSDLQAGYNGINDGGTDDEKADDTNEGDDNADSEENADVKEGYDYLNRKKRALIKEIYV